MRVTTHLRSLFTFALGACALVACRAREDTQHPTNVNLAAMQPAMALPVAIRDSVVAPLRRALASAQASSVDLQPLALNPILGSVGGDGLVALVDRRFSTVRFFDDRETRRVPMTLEMVSDTTLSDPSDVAFTSDRRLWVLDRSRALFEYRPNGDSYAFIGSRELPHRAEGLCVVRDTLFVRGRGDDERLVHVYLPDGRDLTAFGEAYRDPAALVRDQLSRGTIGCDPTSRTVVLSFDALPSLRGYHLDGTLRWEVLVPGLAPVRTRSGSDPKPFVSRDLSIPFDQVTGIRPVAAGFLIVSGIRRQVTHRRQLHETSWHWLLRAADGSLSPIDVSPSLQLLVMSPRFVLAESLGVKARVVAISRRASRATPQ